MKWIDALLCFRQQRVVVNGVKSDWAPVVSGVSQGTVLGPLLFSLHINDIMSDFESEIRLFADDCVCSRCSFFWIQFHVPFKIISLIETSQSIGGAKREYPGKTT